MSLIVTGSIGIDTVKTPFGISEECLGGSAVYFSISASIFSPVRFMGVVGDDCPFDLAGTFKGRDVDLRGLEVRQGSKTFRWHGSYEGAMGDATTDAVELNVLAEAPPVVPECFKDSKFVFLANTHPALQKGILDQVSNPLFVASDTMNLWIEHEREALKELLPRVTVFVLNEGEATLLTGEHNLVVAAKEILELGPKYVIIKKGEHGSMMMAADGDCFIIPAFPTETVIDPTGAGDSFAGGMMGYIASQGSLDNNVIRRGMVYGTLTSSFAISDFSMHGIINITRQDLEDRLEEYRKVVLF